MGNGVMKTNRYFVMFKQFLSSLVWITYVYRSKFSTVRYLH